MPGRDCPDSSSFSTLVLLMCEHAPVSLSVRFFFGLFPCLWLSWFVFAFLQPGADFTHILKERPSMDRPGVLHVVVTLATLREVGRGEPAATDYAHLEHAAFASQRQVAFCNDSQNIDQFFPRLSRDPRCSPCLVPCSGHSLGCARGRFCTAFTPFILIWQGERAAHSPTKRTIEVKGDLDGGGGAEWDFVLPPPPSETPDY